MKNPATKNLTTNLLRWFSQNARSLPWRTHKSPYATWISEVMLQQTQMDRVVPYFLRFMQRFPSIEILAAAKEDEVLLAFEGLGYYSRARNVHKAAKIIMQRHGGIFPSEISDIAALPGIGPYTTAAIASIAFGYALPSIDANVERVMARLYDIDTPVKQEPAGSRIRALAYTLAKSPEVYPDKVGMFNEAMMELGALICRKKPLCESCPLRELCQSHHLGITHERPVPGKRAPIQPILAVTGVLYHQGKIFVQKRLPEGVWGALWEFPGGRIEEGESPEEAIVREFKEETNFNVCITEKYTVIKHGYTTYRITLHCFALSLKEDTYTLPEPTLTAATEYAWARLEDIKTLAMPAAHRKLADILEEKLNML